MIGVAQAYNCRPSELMDIPDAYTAYCLDEACAVITQRIRDGEEPKDEVFVEKTHYTSPSQLYKKYDGGL